MKDCLFCKIANGEIPSYTLYEDDLVKVFLDINPVSQGHCLIIPKKHYENMLDVDKEIVSHSLDVARKVYKILNDELNMDGLTITQNNMYGQEVKHYHIHLIPRYEKDNLLYKRAKNKIDVEKLFEKIKGN